jgi:5-methylcytosine-specific restriction endonuclease McrA
MGAHAYLDYLDTPEWLARRKRARERADGQCARQLPGQPRHVGPFHTHHLSYDHVGDERPDELEYLCERCHRAEHAPRNQDKRALEEAGQERLFDRWRAVDVRESALRQRIVSLESDVEVCQRLIRQLMTALQDSQAA